MEAQTRTFEVEGLGVRQLDGQRPVITGYAVVFDSWSEIMVDARGRRFRERISPGAFDAAIQGGNDIRALWSHDRSKPLGRTANGTLRLAKDVRGIRVEIDPPSTSWGNDAVESISRGDITGMSFAFSVTRDGGDTWARGMGGIAEHTLLEANLHEVSPVAEPAYPATSVSVRSLEVPDFESDSRAADEIREDDNSRAAGAPTPQDYLLAIEIRRGKL